MHGDGQEAAKSGPEEQEAFFSGGGNAQGAWPGLHWLKNSTLFKHRSIPHARCCGLETVTAAGSVGLSAKPFIPTAQNYQESQVITLMGSAQSELTKKPNRLTPGPPRGSIQISGRYFPARVCLRGMPCIIPCLLCRWPEVAPQPHLLIFRRADVPVHARSLDPH